MRASLTEVQHWIAQEPVVGLQRPIAPEPVEEVPPSMYAVFAEDLDSPPEPVIALEIRLTNAESAEGMAFHPEVVIAQVIRLMPAESAEEVTLAWIAQALPLEVP